MSTSPTGYDADFDVTAFTQRFMLAAGFLADLDDDMRQFQAVMDAVHNVGWFIDPTRYRDMQQRAGNADDVAELVVVGRQLAAKVIAFRERFGPERIGQQVGPT